MRRSIVSEHHSRSIPLREKASMAKNHTLLLYCNLAFFFSPLLNLLISSASETLIQHSITIATLSTLPTVESNQQVCFSPSDCPLRNALLTLLPLDTFFHLPPESEEVCLRPAASSSCANSSIRIPALEAYRDSSDGNHEAFDCLLRNTLLSSLPFGTTFHLHTTEIRL